MSGPFPPPGYPERPGAGGWPGPEPPDAQPAGRQHPSFPAASSSGEPPTYEFPSLPYGGLAGQPEQYDQYDQYDQYGVSGQYDSYAQYGQTGQQAPPDQPAGPGGPGGGRPPGRRKTGLIVGAVLGALVLVAGGVLVGVLLVHKHQLRQASPATGLPEQLTDTSTAPPAASVTDTSGADATGPQTATSGAGQVDGNTSLVLSVGDCAVGAVVGGRYVASQKVACGSVNSDLVLAKLVPNLGGCATRSYLRLQAATGVYCFTLDLKQGDCTNNVYLKTACGQGAYRLIKTEPGPVSTASCLDVAGATRWVPVGRSPELVGCIGSDTGGGQSPSRQSPTPRGA